MQQRRKPNTESFYIKFCKRNQSACQICSNFISNSLNHILEPIKFFSLFWIIISDLRKILLVLRKIISGLQNCFPVLWKKSTDFSKIVHFFGKYFMNWEKYFTEYKKCSIDYENLFLHYVKYSINCENRFLAIKKHKSKFFCLCLKLKLLSYLSKFEQLYQKERFF